MTGISQAHGRSARRLRLRAGTAVTVEEDAVVFLGLAGSTRIGGADALRVVLPLARLLDDARTVDELADRSGLPVETTARVCELLRGRGLLADATDATITPMRGYLASILEVVPSDAEPTAQLARLGRARVRVLAGSSMAARLIADLTACDVPDAAVMAAGDPPDPVASLVIVQRGVLASADTDRVVAAARDNGSTVLTLAHHDDVSEIGPAFEPRSGACHECFRLSARDEFGAGVHADVNESCGRLEILVGMVVQEALALLGSFAEPASRATVLRLRWADLTTESYVLGAREECEVCRPGDSMVDAYDHLTALRLPRRAMPSSVVRRQNEFLRTLSTSRPRFDHHPRIPLPRVSDRPPAVDGHWSERTVATLLALTAGFRDPASPNRRWAASGGNLGSAELYVVGQCTFLGRPPGTVLRYDDLTHELIVVHARTCRALAGPDTDDVVHVVLTANVGRLSSKYADFGLQLAHVDAGYALEQLVGVATLLGLTTRVQSWPDGLPDELELFEESEVVTACVRLAPARTRTGS